MKHENEPEDGLPVCNFCNKEYDPHDTHTCQGNQILPAKPRKVSPTAIGRQPGCPACTAQSFACEAHYDRRYPSPLPAYPEFDGIEGLGSALATQQGGDHYRKLSIQPVEYIIANGIGFLAGNVIKYASRYKDKGGAEDIRKIKHYCDLILEFEYKETK